MTPFRPWQIRHHDITAPPPTLDAADRLGGVFLVVWIADVPLGHAEIPADWLPLGGGEVRDIITRAIAPAVGQRLMGQAFRPTLPYLRRQPTEESAPPLRELLAVAPLEQLTAKLAAADSATPAEPTERLSVVVCTRDRPEDLARCLRSLAACSPAPDEILVVDNAPASGQTRAVVERFAGVAYVPEPRPGLSAARNRGVLAAAGQIIAFTDDDVEVHPRWIARVRASFTRPEVLAVTGLVLPASLENESQWIFEKEFGGFSQGYRAINFDPAFFRASMRKGAPVWHIGAGANMAFRRRAFAEVGLFDERLGAGAAGCSEDSELWYRLLAAGWTCRYDPAAVVFHHHRADASALRSQMYNYMKGHVATLLVQTQRHRHFGNLYRLLVVLPAYYVKRTVFGRTYQSDARFRMIPHELRGCVAGLGYFLRHPRARRPRLPRGMGSR